MIAGLELGNVFVAIQPPRGYGENPVAIYHDPDLAARAPLPRRLPLAGPVAAPTRSSTSASTARSSGCRARALGLSSELRARRLPSPTCRSSTRSSSTTPARACRPSAAPTPSIVDHLMPPMMRAETYDELAKLEQLLDEYAALRGARPGQAADAARTSIWTLLHEAELHHDLDIEGEQPDARGLRRR